MSAIAVRHVSKFWGATKAVDDIIGRDVTTLPPARRGISMVFLRQRQDPQQREQPRAHRLQDAGGAHW